jgi:cysteinyl-tRNA synthetase
MLLVEGKKMSKSLGNFFTVRDLLDQGEPGEVIRFVMLSTHYSKPMDWTRRKAFDAADALRKMASMLGRAGADVLADLESTEPFPEVVEALSDDLNTHLAVTHIRNAKPGGADYDDDLKGWVRKVYASQLLLGLDLRNDAQAIVSGDNRDAMAVIMSGVIGKEEEKYLALLKAKLIRQRNEAMRSKDFTKVDALKASLVNAGIEVRMTRDSIDLVPGPDFDAAQLEALQ